MKMGWFKSVKEKDGQVAKDHNGWWLMLQQWWNDHDSGVKAWTKVLTGSLSTTTANGGTGNITADSLTITTITAPSLTNWTAYTATFSAGWGTIASQTIRYRRIGDTLYVHGAIQLGTVAASTGTISLPTGLAIDTAKIPQGGRGYAGIIFNLSAASGIPFADAVQGVLVADSVTTSQVYLSVLQNGGTWNVSNVSPTFGNSALCSLDFSVPISGWSF